MAFRHYACIVVALVMIPSSVATAEKWTSLNGAQSIEAELVGLWQNSLVLRKSDGQRVAIDLDKLDGKSRLRAKQVAAGLDGSRSQRIIDLQNRALSAAASAPNPLPRPPAAPAYVAPQANAKPDQFLRQIANGIEAGHVLRVLYESLPPSYRQDIAGVVRHGAENLSAKNWQSLVETPQLLGNLILTRQNWVFSSQRFLDMPASQRDILKLRLLSISGALRDGLTPEALTLDLLRSADLGAWIIERDEAMAPHLAQLFDSFDLQRSVSIESEEEGVATISIEVGDQVHSIVYTAVEGYWVPKSLADGWATVIKDARKEAANGTLISRWASALKVVRPVVQILANAEDSSSFQIAMEPLFPPIAMALDNSLASAQADGGNARGRGRPGARAGGASGAGGGFGGGARSAAGGIPEGLPDVFN